MSFKTILVGLNETERNDALLAQAAILARSFDAHIAGLYVVPAVQLYPSTAFEAMPVIFEAHREYFQNQRDAVKAKFLDCLRREGVRGDIAVVDSASPLISDATIEHGRVSDLILLSQVDQTGNQGVELDFVDRVMMDVGRPVMVLPLKAKPAESFGIAIVGWNGRREAARAVFDSLPLLGLASEVRVVWVDPQRDEQGPSTIAGSELAEALARHGIKATADPIGGNTQDAGIALLTKAFDTGADLLVMGGYGHARFREFILGGATREALRNTTVPVLFSH